MAVKNWNDYVACAETVARSPGFTRLRDRIIDAAALGASDAVIDLGAGTGLLTLPAAETAERVWALDVSPRMTEYLATKSRSAGLDNVEPIVASVISIPMVDGSVDAAISNYCFHHLDDAEKLVALREVERVLTPGGRVVIGDMMFSLSLASPRNRAVVRDKVRSLLGKGPAGAWRLARNGARYLAGRWERPATAEWWHDALSTAGFLEVDVTVFDHEGGIATARKAVA
jgi:ubiquinone/menaquinone biosynthesis C-methylase UbiE